MINLDQIRAQNALKAKADKKGADKLPALIVNNGLLAAAAFAHKKAEHLGDAMNAVVKHLRAPGINQLTKANDARGLVEELSGADSSRLRLATAETLAFLSYLKRFAN